MSSLRDNVLFKPVVRLMRMGGFDKKNKRISKVDLIEKTSNDDGDCIIEDVPQNTGSTQSSSDLEEMIPEDNVDTPLCRICQDNTGKDKLVSPCGCAGSSKFIHVKCLQKWVQTKRSNVCEICNKQYDQRHLKFPRLTASEENTLISALIILVLLGGVTGVGIYLLVAHIHGTGGNITGDIWISLSLLTSGGMGMALFMPWFVMFIWRICLNSKRRRQLPIYINV